MQNHPHELALTWLHQAVADLESARWTFEGSRFDVTCFLSQQVAEKALKAALIFARGTRPRSHLIGKLVEEICTIDPGAAEVLDDVSALDVYYTASRYPDAIGGALPAATFKNREASLALERAAVALAYAESRLT